MAAKRKQDNLQDVVAALEAEDATADATSAPVLDARYDLTPPVPLLAIRDLVDLCEEIGVGIGTVDAALRSGCTDEEVVKLIDSAEARRLYPHIPWGYSGLRGMIVARRAQLHAAQPLDFTLDYTRPIHRYGYDTDKQAIPPAVGSVLLVEGYPDPCRFEVEQVSWFGETLMVQGVTDRGGYRLRREVSEWGSLQVTTQAANAKKRLEGRLRDQLDGVGRVVLSMAKELQGLEAGRELDDAVGEALGRLVAQVIQGTDLTAPQVAAAIMRHIS